MTETRVTVDKAALEAFIAYADETRTSCDSQFLCSSAEYEASDAKFGALVGALGIDPAGPCRGLG